MSYKIKFQAASVLFIGMMSFSIVLAESKSLIMNLPIADKTVHTIQAISADGTAAVGSMESEKGVQAILFKNNSITNLGYLDKDGYYSEAAAVSSDGSIVAGQCSTADGQHAFIWQNGTMSRLIESAYILDSYAAAISANGAVIVGYYHKETDSLDGIEAFRWENGQITGLNDLFDNNNMVYSKATGISADGTVIVGTAFNGSGHEAFRWENGKMKGLGFIDSNSKRSESFASAVSANGSVVVGYCNTSGANKAFRWENGQMCALQSSNSKIDNCQSQATAVSADGSVITGTYESPDGGRVFIWDVINKMRDLKDFLSDDTDMDISGLELLDAAGISADGKKILCRGRNADGASKSLIVILP